MLSDFVKGNKKLNYPILVQKGITLHRLIDEFTDNHSATKNAKKIFQPELGLYAGAFVDIAFDYFLANDKTEFENETALQTFATKTYNTLENFTPIFPEKFLAAFASMKQNNWLYNYSLDYGINKSFEGLTYRAKYINKNHNAFAIFLENKEQFKICYNDFFKDVKQFAQQKQQQLINS